jgi:hypothetical protein
MGSRKNLECISSSCLSFHLGWCTLQLFTSKESCWPQTIKTGYSRILTKIGRNKTCWKRIFFKSSIGYGSSTTTKPWPIYKEKRNATTTKTNSRNIISKSRKTCKRSRNRSRTLENNSQKALKRPWSLGWQYYFGCC